MNSSRGLQSNDLNRVPLKQAILTMRIIWASLILGQLVFFVVLVAVILPQHNSSTKPPPLLNWICLAMAIVVAPATFLFRRTMHRALTPDGKVPPSKYFIGSLFFWAGCEGVSFFALILIMLNGSIWPTIAISVPLIALQGATIPMAGNLAEPENPTKT